MDSLGRRVGHYCDSDEILIVGDGDFSFSLSLAEGFGAANNIVSTSLDDRDMLMKKYQNAIPNIQRLLSLGCTVMHGVDATKMKRIVFNFPHAGFHGKEDNEKSIRMHKKLLESFFLNAFCLLQQYGEVHVPQKPVSHLQNGILKSGFILVERVKFDRNDYPGYNHKQGSGNRPDEPFPLGGCSTFKFQIKNVHKGKASRNPAELVAGVHHSGKLLNLLQIRKELARSGINQKTILIGDTLSHGRLLRELPIHNTAPPFRLPPDRELLL